MTTDPKSLAQRVTALERSYRRIRAAVLALALVVVALTTLAMTDGQPAELRARSLDIVNEDGTIVVLLGVRSSGAGGFWLTDAGGNRVVHLNQSPDGSGRLVLSSPDGEPVASLPGD
jgi:hypothetical protein